MNEGPGLCYVWLFQFRSSIRLRTVLNLNRHPSKMDQIRKKNDAGLFEIKHTPAKQPGLHLGHSVLSSLEQSGCALYGHQGHDRWIVAALISTACASSDACALVWTGTSALCPLLSYPTKSKSSHLIHHAQTYFIVMNPMATLLKMAIGIIPYILVKRQSAAVDTAELQYCLSLRMSSTCCLCPCYSTWCTVPRLVLTASFWFGVITLNH